MRGVFIGALVYCVLALTGAVPYTSHGEPLMGDAMAYYYSDTPYDWSDRPSGAGEYRYSPAFLNAISPLRLVEWDLFAALWFVMLRRKSKRRRRCRFLRPHFKTPTTRYKSPLPSRYCGSSQVTRIAGL